MLTLKIGICDDDEIYCNDIEQNLTQFMIANDVNFSHQIYKNPFKLLSEYTAEGIYDILFLDIEMPLLDGLTLAQKIRKIDRSVYIIFVSNYPQYMQDSFRTHPFYYLIKPLNYSTYSTIMKDIISNIEAEYKLTTLLHLDKMEETVNIKDIQFIDVEDGKKGILRFHFFNRIVLAKGTIQEWEVKLSDYDYFLGNRGLLINMSHIHYIEPKYATMDNGEKVPLSRNKEKKLREIYAKNIVKLKNL